MFLKVALQPVNREAAYRLVITVRVLEAKAMDLPTSSA